MAQPSGSTGSNPAWAARLPDGGAPRVALPPPQEERFAHLAWPKAVRLGDGAVLLACLAARFHGAHGGGSPAVARSENGGATFSESRVLRVFGPDRDYSHSGNAALGVAADGAVVLLAMAYTAEVGHHIFGWRSADGGRNWEATDTSALGPDKTGSVFGRVLAMPDGGLLVLGHYRADGAGLAPGIWAARSHDGGASWRPPQRVTESGHVEPTLTRCGCRLIAFLRGKSSGEAPGAQSLAVSDDEGRTWRLTPPLLFASDASAYRLAAPFAMPDPDREDGVIALATERHLRGRTPGAIWLWEGSSETLDFERRRKLLEFPRVEGDANTDFGYPWLVHLAARSWRMYYYHGASKGPNSIWACDIDL